MESRSVKPVDRPVNALLFSTRLPSRSMAADTISWIGTKSVALFRQERRSRFFSALSIRSCTSSSPPS